MTGGSAPVAPHPWRAVVGRWIGIGIFRGLYRGRAQHAERVPLTGPVILVANHAAFLDGPFVFSLAPRPVNFLVKQEAFTGFFGWLIRAVGQIPIDRTVGDRAALATATAVLERGGAVGIFPEGNRGAGDLTRLHHGATYLALVSGAPIVPLMMFGTRPAGGGKDSLPTPKAVVDLVYGAPFHVTPRPWPRTKRLVAATSTQLHERMRTELEAGLALTGQTLPGPIPVASAKEMS